MFEQILGDNIYRLVEAVENIAKELSEIKKIEKDKLKLEELRAERKGIRL